LTKLIFTATLTLLYRSKYNDEYPETKTAMFAVLFGQGEVLVIVIVTAIIVFFLIRKRKK
jgi:hypothetical protein